jgi:U3 small nucleolar RNA-associated protein 18
MGKKRPATGGDVRAKGASVRELESIVFGNGALGLGKDSVEEPELEPEEAVQETDVAAPKAPSGKKRKKRKAGVEDKPIDAGAPAWVDADDAALTVDLKARDRTKKLRKNFTEDEISGVEYEKRLREQFKKLQGINTWADQTSAAAVARTRAAADSSDEEAGGAEAAVPTSTRAVLKKSRDGPLKPREIDWERLREVEVVEGKKKGPAAIQALNFHPNSELLLCAGMDKTLRLFAIDGEENPKVSSHFFKDFPIFGAKFTPSGDQILMTSLDNKMLGFDVGTGKSFRITPFDSQPYRRVNGPYMGPGPGDGAAAARSGQLYALLGDTGAVLLFDLRTKLPVRTMRMSSLGAPAAVFSSEREVLYTADQEAHIYEWDLGTGRCLHRTRDQHAMRVSTLALSRATARTPRPVLAVGTVSGNIDLFDAGGPKLSDVPTRSVDNLTTRVSGIRFHQEGEIFAGFSQFTKDALRLVHTSTGTAYANWPASRAPIGTVSQFDFARENGLMAVGNEKGRVLLYRLSHYEKANKN